MFGRTSPLAPTFIASAGGSNVLYSNINKYIIDRTRLTHGASSTNDASSSTIRSNITRNSVISVGGEINIEAFVFVRTPTDNWTTLANPMSLTLSLAAGSTGTINGGSGSVTLSNVSTKNYPISSRYSGVDVNNATARAQYDFNYVYSTSQIKLTAGTYNLAYNSAGGNVVMADLYTSKISVDTTRIVYPDTTSATNTTQYPVMQILSGFP
jgi:hypothetical protein